MKLLIIAFVAFWTACAAPSVQTIPDPIDAVEGYAEALNQGDLTTAYQFLDEDLRGSMTQPEFERLFERHGEAMKKEARTLVEQLGKTPPREEVWFSLGAHRAHLIRTRSGWRMTGVLEPAPGEQRTPKPEKPE